MDKWEMIDQCQYNEAEPLFTGDTLPGEDSSFWYSKYDIERQFSSPREPVHVLCPHCKITFEAARDALGIVHGNDRCPFCHRMI